MVRDEETGKQLEIVFAELRIAERCVMLLIIVIALGIHLPIFTAEASLHAQFAEMGCCRSIQGMDVLVVDKTIVIRGVHNRIPSIKITTVSIRFLRGIFMIEFAVITSLQLELIAELVFIVHFYLPGIVTDMHRTILIIVSNRGDVVKIRRTVLIIIIIIHVPLAARQGEIQEMLV